jgi:DNA topoisomerase-1
MRIAQKLYEAGHITYMRTDSTNLAAQAVSEIAAMIKKTYGEEMLLVRTYKTKSKNAQEAHEAIRPTSALKKSITGTPEQQQRRPPLRLQPVPKRAGFFVFPTADYVGDGLGG